jgi:hypothetical protein
MQESQSYAVGSCTIGRVSLKKGVIPGVCRRDKCSQRACRAFCASCFVTNSTKAKPLWLPNFIGSLRLLSWNYIHQCNSLDFRKNIIINQTNCLFLG